ncbi:MAG TPA: M14 metallopeptidase family protein [Kofleriaceae bacterium]
MLGLELARVPRWMVVAGIAASLVTWGARTKRDPRVAIRVDCHVAAACLTASSYALDVWSEEEGPELPLDLVVHASSIDALTAAHVPFTVTSPDIDANAREEADRIAHDGSTDFFADYRDYTAIVERMRELAAMAPDRVEIQAIGVTLEGRPIWALKIGHGATHVLVNGTQHAREWISTMVNMSIADRMVRNYATDPAVHGFVDSSTLWVVPVVNPDGYQYTWGTDRYWRKNRRDRHGVDLNRNWSVAWGGAGASKSRSSDTYRGEYAFSEPETQALRNLAKREHFTLHVDFHAFSQLILYPWGWTAKPAADHARFAGVGDKMASAMFAQHETRYRLMQSVELYPASGTMEDWMYGEGGALSYTIELRPKNGLRNGFVLPPAQIKPTSDEAFAALLALSGN